MTVAEDLFPELGDAQPQRLDQLVMRAQGRRYLGILRLQGGDHRLQKLGIIRQFGGGGGHTRV